MRSRTDTLVAALQRLDITLTKYKGEHEFRLHVIGSDEMEVNCFAREKLMQTYYGKVFREIQTRGFSALRLVFIGPSMPSAILNKTSTFEYRDTDQPDDQTGLQVMLSFENHLYHEFWSNVVNSQHTSSDSGIVPHLVVLFNPGLWGYASWLPTLQLFFTNHAFFAPKYDGEELPPVYYVITSYTWEESEVDYDAMYEFYSQEKESFALLTTPADTTAGKYELTWLWDCEVNPHGSAEPCSVVRTTCAPSTVYHDNYAWQCICMNKGTVNN